MHKVRSRLVNFRVTDEEFERLKNAAEIQGSRCLSEFARLVMLGADSVTAAEARMLDGKFAVFDKRLNALESDVARLIKNSDAPESDPHSDVRGTWTKPG
jgi:uncharacterized protein (DUF1778 family)